ncbi:hypothetical protein RUM43_014874 [Polyplax serrata]|uniref:Uncharacterized protein n=1 Tax=Polyplax serrata TaxID=468196 RepID=A0AAN8RZ91_POLSC
MESQNYREYDESDPSFKSEQIRLIQLPHPDDYACRSKAFESSHKEATQAERLRPLWNSLPAPPPPPAGTTPDSKLGLKSPAKYVRDLRQGENEKFTRISIDEQRIDKKKMNVTQSCSKINYIYAENLGVGLAG